MWTYRKTYNNVKAILIVNKFSGQSLIYPSHA